MNLTETNKPFYGVVDGIYYNQQDIRNEMNDSIFSRGVPQTPSLKPYFEKRSVATKYEYFPAMFGKTKQQSDIHEAMHENPTSMYPPPLWRCISHRSSCHKHRIHVKKPIFRISTRC